MKRFISQLILRLGLRPKYPSDYILKYILLSKKKRSQLQLIHNNNILVQVDPLKFVPSWFNFVNDSFISKYHDGHVVFFIIDKKGEENNIEYRNYKKNKDFNMIEIEEKHGEAEIITIAKFFESNTDHIVITNFLKKIVDLIIMPENKSFDIFFQIQNLENMPG
jgi:hypothetical protein